MMLQKDFRIAFRLRVLAAACLAVAPSPGNAQVQSSFPSANQVYAGPASGPAAQPGFRALVPADLGSALTSQAFDAAFCATANAILLRGASAWACQTTLPAVALPAFGSGDVSCASGGGACTIAAGAVSNAKRANMAANSVSCNPTGAAGVGQDCTSKQTQTVLNSTQCLNITSSAFGGVGDNSTDNTTPLNTALAALTGTGGCIYFPPGKYKFNSSVSFSLPAGIFSMGLLGSGQDNTILTWPNASGGITFNYAGISSSAHIRDLSFTTGTTAGGNALTLNLATSVANPADTAISDVYRVTMRGDDGYAATDYWSLGLNIANVSNIQIENLAVIGAASANGTGISIIGLPGSSTYGVQYNIAKSALQFLTSGIVYNSFVQGVTVDQTNFTGNINGIISPASQTGTLAQLAVTNSQFNPAASGGGIVTSTSITEVLIANNLFIALASNINTINLVANNHFVITGNEITSGNLTGTGGILVNTTSAGAKGIIANNDIFGFATGIALQAGSQNVSVQGNTFTGNTTTISNSGTGNIIVNNSGYNPVGPGAITVTASPFTYTAGASPETVYIWAGTVSSVTFDKNGGALGTVACASSPCTVDLGPFEQTKVTYTVAPNMNKMVH